MEEVKQKSWFKRNWPWVVPVGGCLVLIVLFVLGIGAAIFGVSKAISSSGPYTYAVQHAIKNEAVIAVLGEPIETDGIMQGSISTKNRDSGEVDIKIPLKGPNGTAKVAIVGTKVDGDWMYSSIYVIINETDQQINLLDTDAILEDF